MGWGFLNPFFVFMRTLLIEFEAMNKNNYAVVKYYNGIYDKN